MKLEGRRPAVLLTEGSSLSARQTLYALGGRYRIDVCDARPFRCLARYSRYVRACYRCPPFAADPLGYLNFLTDRVRTGHYDVLFPVHDQVYLLSRFRDLFAGRVGLPVPEFSALERVQSKAAFVRLLDELGLPHPPTVHVCSREELVRACAYPCYVKLPYSTAGCGVWLVHNAEELEPLARTLEAAESFRDDGVLVQQPAPGTLCVVQTVFQRGRLLAGHAYQARALGVGGSARARVSIHHPQVLDHVRTLGGSLRWHGALMLDYLYDSERGQSAYIDANPRIGETFNATRSGVNLCAVLIQVALEGAEPARPCGRSGIRTHSVLTSLLAAAQGGATRCNLLAELGRTWMGQGLYAGSQDELTRPREDPLSLIPAAFLTLQLLVRPWAAGQIVAQAVNAYALSEATVRAIHQLPTEAVRRLTAVQR